MFFFSSRRRHTRLQGDWSSDVCSSDLLSSEMLASALAGYPYRAKAWINHMSNPVYGIAGFRNALVDDLKDPKKLPLIVSIDPFINETSALADFIVPDTVTYERDRKSTRLNSSHLV